MGQKKKQKSRKTLPKPPLSSLCVGNLLLGMGTALKCALLVSLLLMAVWNLISIFQFSCTSHRNTMFSFSTVRFFCLVGFPSLWSSLFFFQLEACEIFLFIHGVWELIPEHINLLYLLVIASNICEKVFDTNLQISFQGGFYFGFWPFLSLFFILQDLMLVHGSTVLLFCGLSALNFPSVDVFSLQARGFEFQHWTAPWTHLLIFFLIEIFLGASFVLCWAWLLWLFSCYSLSL